MKNKEIKCTNCCLTMMRDDSYSAFTRGKAFHCKLHDTMVQFDENDKLCFFNYTIKENGNDYILRSWGHAFEPYTELKVNGKIAYTSDVSMDYLSAATMLVKMIRLQAFL